MTSSSGSRSDNVNTFPQWLVIVLILQAISPLGKFILTLFFHSLEAKSYSILFSSSGIGIAFEVIVTLFLLKKMWGGMVWARTALLILYGLSLAGNLPDLIMIFYLKKGSMSFVLMTSCNFLLMIFTFLYLILNSKGKTLHTSSAPGSIRISRPYVYESNLIQTLKFWSPVFIAIVWCLFFFLYIKNSDLGLTAIYPTFVLMAVGIFIVGYTVVGIFRMFIRERSQNKISIPVIIIAMLLLAFVGMMGLIRYSVIISKTKFLPEYDECRRSCLLVQPTEEYLEKAKSQYQHTPGNYIEYATRDFRRVCDHDCYNKFPPIRKTDSPWQVFFFGWPKEKTF